MSDSGSVRTFETHINSISSYVNSLVLSEKASQKTFPITTTPEDSYQKEVTGETEFTYAGQTFISLELIGTPTYTSVWVYYNSLLDSGLIS